MLWLFNVLKAMIVLLGIFVGLAFLLPSHRHVERSLDISAPVQRVWGLIADPQQWTTWSPWSSKNPTLKVRFDAAESPKLLTYTLTWVDMGSQAKGAFRLEPMPLGTHVSIDVVSRAFSARARAWIARAGGVLAATVCVLAAWGFFDFTAIDAFHAPPTATRVEKWSVTTRGLARHGSLAWKQLTLDTRMLGRVLGGARWDRALPATEWNAWLGDAEEFTSLRESDSSVMRMPLLAMPGESPRGLLVKDLNLVVPLGLLWLAVRFLLWVLRGAPAEAPHGAAS